MKYIPKYITTDILAEYGEHLTHEAYNEMVKLNITQGDYNTTVLNQLFNTDEGIQIPYLDNKIKKVTDDQAIINEDMDNIVAEMIALKGSLSKYTTFNDVRRIVTESTQGFVKTNKIKAGENVEVVVDANNNVIISATGGGGGDVTKAYVDEQDAATLQSSKGYTDTKISQIPIPVVPTNISAFNNDVGYITSETDPVFSASPAAGITSEDITSWGNKSDFSGNYADLSGKPDLSVYVDKTSTQAISGSKLFTTIPQTNKQATENNHIINKKYFDEHVPVVPTDISAFNNDSGYITGYTETDPVFGASPAAGILSTDITDWDNNITIRGPIFELEQDFWSEFESVYVSDLTAADRAVIADIKTWLDSVSEHYDLNQPFVIKGKLYDHTDSSSDTVDWYYPCYGCGTNASRGAVMFDAINNRQIMFDLVTDEIYALESIDSKVDNIINTLLPQKQNKLISGTNIKTINSNSILSAGDIKVPTNLVNGSANGSLRGINSQVEVNDQSDPNYYIMGSNAMTVGNGTKATGNSSIAAGPGGAVASGTGAVAIGYGASASGSGAFALGSSANASGNEAFALGTGATASGSSSLALGSGATANGTGGTMVVGSSSSTSANSFSSVVLGLSSSITGSSQGCAAIGYLATATGIGNTAFNQGNASGNFTHAEGSGTASSSYSHAEGQSTVANGTNAHAEGSNTEAGNMQHAEGFYNLVESLPIIHMVGNGTSNNRSNAYTLDQLGRGWFAQDVYVGSTSGTHRDSGSVKLLRETVIAPTYDDTATYAVGDYVMYAGELYECNTAIVVAEAWDSTHWTSTTLATLLGNIATALGGI